MKRGMVLGIGSLVFSLWGGDVAAQEMIRDTVVVTCQKHPQASTSQIRYTNYPKSGDKPMWAQMDMYCDNAWDNNAIVMDLRVLSVSCAGKRCTVSFERPRVSPYWR